MVENIVLAYSGGLDTSVATHWLGQAYDADVTCLMVDMGQPPTELKQAEARALANGAQACRVPSCEAGFATEHVAPAIKANALYQDAYPLATALARPLIAEQLVAAAHEVGADAVAHGCTGKGNDQVRIEAAVRALDPELTLLAPQRTDAMTRDEALAYAGEHDLELPEIEEESLFSVDANLWGRSVEGGPLELDHGALEGFLALRELAHLVPQVAEIALGGAARSQEDHDEDPRGGEGRTPPRRGSRASLWCSPTATGGVVHDAVPVLPLNQRSGC
jgi:argininosuccinate synthase